MTTTPVDWVFTTKERSLDELFAQVRNLIERRVNGLPDQPMDWAAIPAAMSPASSTKPVYWVQYLYPDYAILRKGETYFRQNYHMGEGELFLDGEPFLVEMSWVPVPESEIMKEAPVSPIVQNGQEETAEGTKGGPGSGNFGHAGRPGHRGGSGPKSGMGKTRFAHTEDNQPNLDDIDVARMRKDPISHLRAKQKFASEQLEEARANGEEKRIRLYERMERLTSRAIEAKTGGAGKGDGGGPVVKPTLRNTKPRNYSPKQESQVVNMYAKKFTVSNLRGKQTSVRKQIERAYAAHDDNALGDLQKMDDIIAQAINIRAFEPRRKKRRSRG